MNCSEVLLESASDGSPSGSEHSLELYSSAFKNRNVDTMNNYASLLHAGEEGVPANPQHALELYTRAIQNGNVDAMNSCAILLQTGAEGVPADPQRALELYNRAIQNGNVDAMNSCAILLHTGAEGVPPNPKRALELYNRAIENGNVKAMNNCALLVQSGAEGVPADPQRALELCNRAIENGNVDALNTCAILLHTGAEGVPADPQRALELYNRAVENGNVDAMKNCAFLLRFGAEGVPADPLRALELYNRAIECGDVTSMYNCAVLLEEGTEGVRANPQNALELYNRAIENGNVDAMNNCAILLHTGEEGVPPNPQRALELYDRAIECGNVDAMNNCASLLHTGEEGVPANPKRALELYNRAINNGNVDAMKNCAILLHTGAEGVPPDPQRALDLYNRAIENGNVKALNSCAVLLHTGAEGVRADPLRALELYNRAIENGNVDAMNSCASLLHTGAEGVPANPQRALELYTRAIEKEHVIAMRNCAIMLQSGAKGVPADPLRALGLYNRAIECGDIIAMYSCAILLEKGAEGVPANPQRALKLYTRAIESGHVDAPNTCSFLPPIGVEGASAVTVRAPDLYIRSNPRFPEYSAEHLVWNRNPPTLRYVDTLMYLASLPDLYLLPESLPGMPETSKFMQQVAFRDSAHSCTNSVKLDIEECSCSTFDTKEKALLRNVNSYFNALEFNADNPNSDRLNRELSNPAYIKNSRVAYALKRLVISEIIRRSRPYAGDILVLSVFSDLIVVHSNAGIVVYKECVVCSKCWHITDGFISTIAKGLSVSSIFELAYDRIDNDREMNETLFRVILHTVVVSDCLSSKNACYGLFVKKSADYFTYNRAVLGPEEENLYKLFPFDLDLPICLSFLLRIFNVEMFREKPFLISKRLRVPFSFDKGFIHVGEEGKLSKSAMKVILDLKDEVLVGTNVASLSTKFRERRRTNYVNLEITCVDSNVIPVDGENKSARNYQTRFEDVNLDEGKSNCDDCQYIHALGHKSIAPRANKLIGLQEVKAQMQRMGVSYGIMNAILLEKYTTQKHDDLETTCDEVALEVASYIRSYESTINQPIVLKSEKKGILHRISKSKSLFRLRQAQKPPTIEKLRRNVTFSGNLELNAGVVKAGMTAQEAESSSLIEETPKLSNYVAALANIRLKNDLVELDNGCSAWLWFDPNGSNSFQTACLIALWTMDPSVEFVGELCGIEDARWRRARGLPKDKKCILDVPISQFVHTLGKTKISELTPVNRTFLTLNECNVMAEEKCYVGREREPNIVLPAMDTIE